ncbi:MAG: hypothetical protein ACC635_02530 [Acidiferrobacterales bacterium]
MVGSVTKNQLIDLLSFPSQLIEEQLNDLTEDCPHELRFASEDKKCLACDLEDECRWLSSNDDFSPLKLRSIPELVDALETALTYVRGDVITWGHESGCVCQVCEWLGEAQQVYDAIDLDHLQIDCTELTLKH